MNILYVHYRETMADTHDCSICCEIFNKSVRKQISCAFCNAHVCYTCVKTYLLNSIDDANCMHCKKPWSIEFIGTNTPNAFHNKEYRDYRAGIAVEREKSLMPETMAYVEQQVTRKKLLNENQELRKKRSEMRVKIYENERILYNRNNNINMEKKKFIRACMQEDCRGFLSTQWKCGLCDRNYCNKCLAEKTDDEHKCKEEDVQTADMLKDNVKPCPKCGEGIFKISGCDQMYCTSCHTAFSWRSGQIVSGVIHNPHYYEWQRSQNGGVAPRVPGDIPCGGLIDYRDLRYLLQSRELRSVSELLGLMHRLTRHVERVELRTYTIVDVVEYNRFIRARFMMNEIDEKQWKQLIKNREKRYNKYREINQIFSTFVAVMSDLFRGVVQSQSTITLDELNDVMIQMNAIKD